MKVKSPFKYIFLYVSLFVYIVSVSGVTINKHFCGGELEEVSILEKGSCCEGETEEPDDCCSNETVVIVNSTETIVNSSKISFDQKFYTLFCVLVQPDFLASESTVKTIAVKPEKPPLPGESEPCSLMVFRI